ncbi:MAG: HlyD family efflux transporter periplasmic adaptor subunit [Desulfobacteraceae bacterium]|nr:HlyD family efflux transporter periplasmic adaptor subunit [Desulfobacteraceae bacterium]MBC2755368.1 HlyD family efflux transporter periplasmic adaptor subunit [Desulfobacteraceae bacterium]
MRKNTIIPVLFLVLSAAGCGTTNDSAIQASGQIEAKEIAVASELSGRVVAVFAAEGDSVRAGDPLLRLDDSLLLSEKQAAEAALDSAHASVRVAQTALDSALVQYEMALTAALFEEALLTRKKRWMSSKPDEYNQPVWYFSKEEQICSAQSTIDSASDALGKAQNNLNEISKKADSAEFLEIERRLSDARMAFDIARAVLDSTDLASDGMYLRDAAQVTHDKAGADLMDAQKACDDALTTEGARDVLKARAGLEVARESHYTALDTLRALQTGEQSITVIAAGKAVEQARAMLEQAESAVAAAQPSLDLVSTQMDKLTIRAPMDGVVLIRSIEAGEVLQAGMPAMSIGKLDELKVRVYIPVTEYGQLSLGQQANLTADSFAGETFIATVTRIAEKFEFTPQNVQTREGRQTTVYAIELTVENADGKLKPGMPVDVTFETVAK